MFDTFFKSKFYSKCKTAIKLTKTRTESMKRKRTAIENFLKIDIIDLLKNDLDINAYGRAEGLLIEMNMTECYNLVLEFCVCLLKEVSKMDKQRDCPEQCKEAVPSLMHAAARFADLPELRKLRQIFLLKYGESIEANINREFIHRLKATPPTKDMKIQLLQKIALESGKTWDSKALEQKLYVPPPFEHGLSDNTNDENNTLPKRTSSVPSTPKRVKDAPSFRTRRTSENEINKSHSERNLQRVESNLNKPQSKFSPPVSYHQRSSTEDKYESLANGNNHELKNEEPTSFKKKYASAVSFRRWRFSWDQDENLANGNNAGNKENLEKNEHERRSVEKPQFQSKFAPPVHYIRTNDETYLIQEKPQQQDDSVDKPKPKPKPKSVRSVRSRRSMIPPDEDKIGKNYNMLEEIRQELATKPGHKST